MKLVQLIGNSWGDHYRYEFAYTNYPFGADRTTFEIKLDKNV